LILFQNYVLRGYPLDSLVNTTEREKRLLRHALLMESEAMNKSLEGNREEDDIWREG
jgi:hypothetical protein